MSEGKVEIGLSVSAEQRVEPSTLSLLSLGHYWEEITKLSHCVGSITGNVAQKIKWGRSLSHCTNIPAIKTRARNQQSSIPRVEVTWGNNSESDLHVGVVQGMSGFELGLRGVVSGSVLRRWPRSNKSSVEETILFLGLKLSIHVIYFNTVINTQRLSLLGNKTLKWPRKHWRCGVGSARIWYSLLLCIPHCVQSFWRTRTVLFIFTLIQI